MVVFHRRYKHVIPHMRCYGEVNIKNLKELIRWKGNQIRIAFHYITDTQFVVSKLNSVSSNPQNLLLLFSYCVHLINNNQRINTFKHNTMGIQNFYFIAKRQS